MVGTHRTRNDVPLAYNQEWQIRQPLFQEFYRESVDKDPLAF